MGIRKYLWVILFVTACSSDLASEIEGKYTLDLFESDGVHHLNSEMQLVVKPYDDFLKKVYHSSIPIQVRGEGTYAVRSWGNRLTLIDVNGKVESEVYKFPSKYVLITIANVDDTYIWCSTYSVPYKGKSQIWKVSIKSKKARLIVNATSSNFSYENGKLAYIGSENLIHIRSEDGSERIMDISASSPTLLPNGKGIVYIRHGMFQSVEYRLFSDSRTITIKRNYFGQFNPSIQISNDSSKVAFTQKSDVLSVPIEVFDLRSGQLMLEVEQSKHWLLR